MDTLRLNLRYALRSLSRAPGFTVVVVLALGLGIGATTALFSVVHGVLQRPLPYPDPERIVQLWQVSDEGAQTPVSDANFADLRREGRSFAALAQVQGGGPVSVTGAGEPVRARAGYVSQDFFAVMGVHPARGRAFLPPEQREGGAPAVVVSDEFWREHLGAAPGLSRLTLRFNDRVHQVVGVMPPGAAFPEGTDLWTPRELEPVLPSRTAHNWQVVGRLREDVSVEQARGEVSRIARRLKAELGEDTWMADAALVPLHEQIVGRVRPALLLLLGAAASLLLIACANVSNLLLARTAARRQELAVRMALGAGRGRLLQQFVAESLVLSLSGGAVGLLLATWGVDLLRALQPDGLPRLEDVRVSGGVFAFALGVSVLAALALGGTAALQGVRGDLRGMLSQGQRTVSGGGGRRVRDALVVVQVALTLVLLVGAGLLGRSFLRLVSADTGYRTEGGVVMDLAMEEPTDDAAKARLSQLHDELERRLRAIPGVAEVGGVNDFPLGGSYSSGTFLVLNRPDEVKGFEDAARLFRDESRTGNANYRVASEGYFRAMGIPLVRGRGFAATDAADGPHVALVSESLARARWPGEDPLGKLVQFGNMDGDLRPFTVVGVVGDIREASVDAEPQPTFFGLARQRTAASYRFHVVLRGTAAPEAVIPPARQILRELAPGVPPSFRTVDEVFARSLADRRFSLLLLGAFGAAALLLAMMGIYGVVSYLVAQRTREFGIRMAFGARAGDVVRLVVRHGAVLAATGILLGLGAALALTRLLSSLLYGVSATDPLAFAGVAVGLGAVALAACSIPALRATRVDPMTALRSE